MKRSLTARDWAIAALKAIARSGMEGVAVEPLAREMGVTKGSFYWHFPNRDALIRAALDLWEQQETTDIIKIVGAETEPQQRIQAVFRAANTSASAGRLYLALAAASEDSLVGAVVRRVSQKRMRYLAECYLALGLSEEDADRWAKFAYATFMGTQQIRRDDPEALPRGRDLNEYVRLCMATLIPDSHLQPAPGLRKVG